MSHSTPRRFLPGVPSMQADWPLDRTSGSAGEDPVCDRALPAGDAGPARSAQWATDEDSGGLGYCLAITLVAVFLLFA